MCLGVGWRCAIEDHPSRARHRDRLGASRYAYADVERSASGVGTREPEPLGLREQAWETFQADVAPRLGFQEPSKGRRKGGRKRNGKGSHAHGRAPRMTARTTARTRTRAVSVAVTVTGLARALSRGGADGLSMSECER